MRDLMLRAIRRTGPALRLLRRDQRGSIAVLVAVLIAGGVLFGMGALVIDVGQLYQERAELQNGADAAAIGVAKSCALNAANCTPGAAGTTAVGFADANASKLTSNTAGIDQICGSGSLGACGASTGKIIDCPAPPSGTGVNYVDVHTYTQTGSGSHLLPPVFARTLLGNGNYTGSTVYACAQAEWGGPASADTVAFTISACSWYVYTNNGTTFAQPPPYPPNTAPGSSLDHILFEHGSQGSQTTGCPPYQPSGQDAPGNFGWTTDSGNCSVTINSGSYGGSTGASISNDCKTVLASDQANKTLVFLPVYSAIAGTGNNVTYTLLGFAAFVITGYHITGSFKANDWITGKLPCTGSNFCISGYFTQGLCTTSCQPGGTNLGLTAVRLSG